MLLDIAAVLVGIGLAVVGFVIVILVCVVILRLLAAILPSYDDRSASDSEASPDSEPGSPDGLNEDRESVTSEAGPAPAAGENEPSS